MNIDPKDCALMVARVENGWVVHASPCMGSGYSATQFVARTPQQLADLIANWASAQQDGAPK